MTIKNNHLEREFLYSEASKHDYRTYNIKITTQVVRLQLHNKYKQTEK